MRAAGHRVPPLVSARGWRSRKAGAARSAGSPARRGVTAAQVALAWLLARSPVVVPIPGTSSVAHLEENVAALGLELTDEERAALG